MPLPLAAATALLKVKTFFKGLLSSPWFYAALAFLAVGAGTYFYLVKDKEQDIAAAVKTADSDATIRSYETKEAITTRVVEVDRKFDDLAARTNQDYANARAQVKTAPEEERNAIAPRLLVDTLNDLDRLRQDRDPSGVPDSDIPVG